MRSDDAPQQAATPLDDTAPEAELEDFSRARALELILYTHDDSAGGLTPWRMSQIAYVFAALAHLWLEDAWQLDWLLADLLLLAGAVIILFLRGALLGWVLAIPGLLLPLLTARDQLTQSVILLLLAASAALSLGKGAYDTHKNKGRAREGENHSSPPGLLSSWRVVCASTYALAAVHKLNREYFDPEYSCAVYGWDKVIDYWNLPPEILPAAIVALMPAITVGCELTIFALYTAGYARPARLISIAFHIPLTLTMAPAFAMVMLAGHASFLTRQEIDRAREVIKSKAGIVLGLVALILTAVSLALHGMPLPEVSMIPKEWLLWFLTLLSACWIATLGLKSSKREETGDDGAALFSLSFSSALPILTALVFWGNGLTPYAGVQYQHAAAMLSNLRIDQGCWNSYLFPESVRLRDDYIRVDRAYFNAPGAIPDYENIVTEQLWSPPQLRQMQRNWCKPSARPFYLEGTWRGEHFVIEDLCALGHDELPFEGAGAFGVELFPNALRFQKNLERACPQKCIH